jgi:hypothetical protein
MLNQRADLKRWKSLVVVYIGNMENCGTSSCSSEVVVAIVTEWDMVPTLDWDGRDDVGYSCNMVSRCCQRWNLQINTSDLRCNLSSVAMRFRGVVKMKVDATLRKARRSERRPIGRQTPGISRAIF